MRNTESAARVSAVDMRQILKTFPGVVANDRIDFSVEKGEIHALIGENGAGKTTLMNILYGLYHPTSGSIYLDGEERQFTSPIDAINAGVGMVHQHFMLIPALTVAENIVLGCEPRKKVVFDYKAAVSGVEEICSQYNFTVNPREKTANISLGMQQKVEIIKALYRGAEILIFDEPTAVLTPQEIEELGRVLQDLKAVGKTIILITHKLKEVMAFSDRITVLRSGKKIKTVNTADTTAEEVTYLMVGRHVDLAGNRMATKAKENILEVRDLCLEEKGKQLLKNVSFDMRRGEILGVAGIDGSGQNELSDIIAGFRKATGGTIQYMGRNLLSEQTRTIRERGVGLIPQSRHEQGLVLTMNIAENLILGHPQRKRFIKNRVFLNNAQIEMFARERVDSFQIKTPGLRVEASKLSGGNQQKIICARETGETSEMIIANQPTRGMDIGSIEQIHKVFMDARNTGKSVLMISLELDEVMSLSDRIMVMHNGEVMDIIDAATATREQIGLMMVGHVPVPQEKRCPDEW